MATVDDYTGLVTSEHNQKPKFMAMVEALAGGHADLINALQSMPGAFDLDAAIGVQLDAVGRWVGISRNIATPLSGVYFSMDVDGLGFDVGVWQGPYDPDTGLTSLDDATYRLLIRAKIAANHWDGTLSGSARMLDIIFPPSSGTKIFIVDNGDMSIDIAISGAIPSILFLALLFGGYIPIKPEGVHINGYYVTTEYGSPLFGFDVDNDYIGGFDRGAWGSSDLDVIGMYLSTVYSVGFVADDVNTLVNITLPAALA